MAHWSFCRRPRSETTPPPPILLIKTKPTEQPILCYDLKNDSFPRTHAEQQSNGLSPFSAHSYPPGYFIPFSSTTIPLHYTRTPPYDLGRPLPPEMFHLNRWIRFMQSTPAKSRTPHFPTNCDSENRFKSANCFFSPCSMQSVTQSFAATSYSSTTTIRFLFPYYPLIKKNNS